MQFLSHFILYSESVVRIGVRYQKAKGHRFAQAKVVGPTSKLFSVLRYRLFTIENCTVHEVMDLILLYSN